MGGWLGGGGCFDEEGCVCGWSCVVVGVWRSNGIFERGVV